MLRPYSFCWLCNAQYSPTGTNAKYCDKCRPVVTKIRNRNWTKIWYGKVHHDKEFREKRLQNSRRFYSRHPEKVKIKSAKQYQQIKADPVRYAQYLKTRREQYHKRKKL